MFDKIKCNEINALKEKEINLKIKGISDEMQNLFQECINPNPIKRPCIKQIQKVISKEVYYPYMTKIIDFFKIERQIVTNYYYENQILAKKSNTQHDNNYENHNISG